jgi:hypothetical protein
MKATTRILVCTFLILLSCSEDEGPSTGCLTGVNSSGNRVFIKCITEKQYRAGSNVSAGGTAEWDYYTAHRWEECDNCK